MGSILRLYHGSNQIVEFPRVIISRRTKDFSWGFYCTNHLQQAYRRAERTRGNTVVNAYDYHVNPALKILRFESPDAQWAQFIAKCRAGETHSWDIVEGPMADDQIWNFAQDFVEGRISQETFLSFARFQHPTHQISFHTLAAFQTLQFVGEVDRNGNPIGNGHETSQ